MNPPPLPTSFPPPMPSLDAYSSPYGWSSLPPPPAPPRVWTVFVAFIVACVAGIVGAGIVAAVLAVAMKGPDVLDASTPEGQKRFQSAMLEPPVFLPTLLLTQVVLAGVALSAGLLSPTPLRRRLRLGRAQLPWYGYIVVALGTVALGFTSGIIIELLGMGDKGTLEEFQRALTGLRGPLLIAAAAVIGVAPGFGEELLFRGYIQTRLRQRWPRLLAVAVTAVLFGVIHLDPVQGTFAVVLGLWLGEVADRTGSVWPGAVGHAVNNSVATVAGALGGSEAATTGEVTSWSLVITGLVFLLCLGYLLRRPVLPFESESAPQPQQSLQPIPYYPWPPMAPGGQ